MDSDNGETVRSEYSPPTVTLVEERVGATSKLPRIPASYLLALVGFVLPTVSFTSCSDTVGEASGLQLATGTGTGVADLPVDVAAIVLGLLTVAGAVAWWFRRRAVESALVALAGIAMLEIGLPVSVGNALPASSDISVGTAGGGFLMAIGFWSAFALASIYALAPRIPRTYLIANILMAGGLLIAGVSASGADNDPLFGSPWSIASILVIPAATLDLIMLGIIGLTRKWRSARSAGHPAA